MVVKRFFRILKSNLNSGTFRSGRIKEEPEQPKEEKKQAEQNNLTEQMDLREAEYYANLELKPGSDFSQIKASYKRLMKQYHPDLHIANEEKRKAAELITTRLNEAYKYFETKFNSK